MEKNLKQKQSEIIKIVLFGPESTGKTTLAKQLASHYNTVWAPEFARDYLQEKWDRSSLICELQDMLPIAYGQVQLENKKVDSANKYLFCDTNLLVTKVFSEVYYGFCDPLLKKAALEHTYDLFFLTAIDVPWKKEDLRDKPEGREGVFEVFKQCLIANKKPFILLSGHKELRLNTAISIIESIAKAKEMGFSVTDFVQIYTRGISLESIKKQVEFLKVGVPKIKLVAPARLNDGILKLSELDFTAKATFFEENKNRLRLLKFVPASGAATRMFKFLITFLEEFNIENETINAYINRKKDSELSIFIIAMNKFPFFEAINKKLKNEFLDFETLTNDRKHYLFIKSLLSSDSFNFANKPKGILPFHKYASTIASPIEEHLYECGYYSSSNGSSQLHFTVSPEHQDQFEHIINAIKTKVEQETKTTIEIAYSYQDKKTDTLSFDAQNNLCRNQQHQLVFRPGGHGALIENLNTLDADIVFIKNIDNVMLHNNERIALYKKALAGIVLELQQHVFSFLTTLDSCVLKEQELETIVVFLEKQLNVKMPIDYNSGTLEYKTNCIKPALNRPIRVCGMVKNEGEPGGGPFWVSDSKGHVSLQIVETAQVDLSIKDQVNILNAATHFNPVDLVCGIKNYKNQKFDLTQFVDYNSGFIVEKKSAGKNIKAYELPGLWNGAMSDWLTVFVEVPLLTFNPVKTVNDLLKQAHQSY